MAEVLGIVGSVVGIAAEGIKLSHTLNTYAQKVRYAGNEVKGVANDIQDTAVVLDQLGQNLKSEENYMSMSSFIYVSQCYTDTASTSLQTRILQHNIAQYQRLCCYL